MPTYAAFLRLTDQGAKAIKDSPGRIEAGLKGQERMGAQILGFYICQSGDYDYVSITEWPGDEPVKAYAMALESLGNVRVMWTRVYTPAEFADLVAKLP